LKRYLEKTSFHKTNNYYGKIIGIILIIIGILFLFLPFSFNLKICTTLIFIGIIIILMVNEKKTPQGIDDKQLTLIIIFLAWIVLIITINADFDVYFILIAIGIFAIKEFLNKYLNPFLQKRLDLLSYVLLIFFVIIVVKRIIYISSMYPK